MDHNRAIESQAVERYLLGEMEPEERESFEEHFFTCEECAEEVRAGVRFGANSRQVLPELSRPQVAALRHRLRNWLGPPPLVWVTAALALVVIYQAGFEIPSLRRKMRAQSVPALALRTATRGDDSLPEVPASAGFFTVYFDAPDTTARSYHCVLRDASGKVVEAFSIPAKRNEPITLLFDRRRLARGRYMLTLNPESDTDEPPNQFMFLVE
jgi:hypothetical protein